MALLLKNSMPAERLRGCVFAERFHSSADVVENGGTVTGAPTFDITTGATFDGSSDYITYALSGREFNTSNITIVCEFTPHFDYDADANHTIWDTESYKYTCTKLNNASSNAINYTLNGTGNNIAEGSYSAYWVANGRNVLVLTASSGDIDVYLNGTLIDSQSDAWTPASMSSLYVGDNNAASNKFDGSISSFKIFDVKLAAAEAADYYNNTTFNWRDRALLDLPMLMADHDPVNDKTLNHGTLGSAADADFGAGAAEPTKQTHQRGYLFDSGDDGLVIADQADLRFNGSTEDFSMVFFVTCDNPAHTMYLASKLDAWNDGYAFYTTTDEYRIRLNTTVIATSGDAVHAGLHSVVFSVDRSGNAVIYVDGVAMGSGAATGITMDTTVALNIGRYGLTGSTAWEGGILQHATYNWALSPMQAADYHLQMMKGGNAK